jgi:hypothetical protein
MATTMTLIAMPAMAANAIQNERRSSETTPVFGIQGTQAAARNTEIAGETCRVFEHGPRGVSVVPAPQGPFYIGALTATTQGPPNNSFDGASSVS